MHSDSAVSAPKIDPLVCEHPEEAVVLDAEERPVRCDACGATARQIRAIAAAGV